jgi:hypothetical protein
VRVAIAECFGLPPGATTTGQLVTSLRQLGFDFVFDVVLAADITIMEVRGIHAAWASLLGCPTKHAWRAHPPHAWSSTTDALPVLGHGQIRQGRWGSSRSRRASIA